MTENQLINQAAKYSSVVFLYCDEAMANDELLRFFKDKAFCFAGAQSMVMAACGFALRGKIPVIVADSRVLMSAGLQVRESVVGPHMNVKFLSGEELPGVSLFENMENLLLEFGPGLLRRS